MTLRSGDPGGLGTVFAEVRGRPGGGTLDASTEAGIKVVFSSDASTGRPIFLPMPAVPKGATLTLRARGDGPVDVMSLFAIRDVPGVTYSNLGTIGAKVDEMFRLDPITMRAELARLHPALVLIAFGTNEGFDEKIDTTGYGDVYGRAVRLVRENAPWASIALIGPPDLESSASSFRSTRSTSAKSRPSPATTRTKHG